MTMNKVIVAVLTVVNIFTGLVIWMNYKGLQVQDSLINAFFVLYGAELATMGGIKITKVVKERKILRGTVNRDRRYEEYYENED